MLYSFEIAMIDLKSLVSTYLAYEEKECNVDKVHNSDISTLNVEVCMAVDIIQYFSSIVFYHVVFTHY